MVEESVVKTSEEMDVTIRRQRNHIINQQEQLDEYRLAIDSCCQDLEKRWMDIEHLECSIEVLHTIIQELRTKNNDLETQLEKAVVSGGPHADQPLSKEEEVGQLPHTYVEFSDVEEVEEKKAQEPSFVVQTKSWWRRQIKKLGKGMGTFRLHLKSCLGVKTFKTPVARLINIQPVNSTMNTGMPPVSV